MTEYVILMTGSAASGDWDDYIEKLVSSVSLEVEAQ